MEDCNTLHDFVKNSYCFVFNYLLMINDVRLRRSYRSGPSFDRFFSAQNVSAINLLNMFTAGQNKWGR